MDQNDNIIYGSIGYTILENIDNKHKVIIFADMHDTLDNCYNNTNIVNWLNSKFNTSQILLEEVPRENINIKELWSKSPHTQMLKNLYLQNYEKINAIDIRPYYIPFSWEINNNNDETLMSYIKNIDDFFLCKEHYIQNKIKNYNNILKKNKKLNKHFNVLLRNYKKFIFKYRKILCTKLNDLKDIYLILNNEINNLLDSIMEWYTIFNIIISLDKPVIIHAGLYHTELIIKLLIINYGYKNIHNYGTNKLIEIKHKLNGCVLLKKKYSNQFGGYQYLKKYYKYFNKINNLNNY